MLHSSFKRVENEQIARLDRKRAIERALEKKRLAVAFKNAVETRDLHLAEVLVACALLPDPKVVQQRRYHVQ